MTKETKSKRKKAAHLTQVSIFHLIPSKSPSKRLKAELWPTGLMPVYYQSVAASCKLWINKVTLMLGDGFDYFSALPEARI